MSDKKNPNTTLYVSCTRVMQDWGVSRSRAYKIIGEMNQNLKKNNPDALVIPGKINRHWYERACLLKTK